jgi:hypothetical protein
MGKFATTTLVVMALSLANLGCTGRLISEGVATVTGASGKVVDIRVTRSLSKYKGFKIESLKAAPGVMTPADMPTLIREQLMAAAEKRGLTANGQPAIKVAGEIIHYESGGIVDEAIGPLEEVIVRTKLTDAQSGELLAEANLVGRSKATTSSGAKNLSEGVGKAFDKWLKDGGLKKAGEKEK